MATPLGHALAGVALGSLATGRHDLIGPRADLALFAALAVLPDLDFIPGLLSGDMAAWHHGASHSLGAALLCALAMALIGRRRGGAAIWWAWAGFMVWASHVLVDYLTLDTMPPHGVPVFWPFSAEYFHTDNWIFLDVKRGLSMAVFWHDIKAAVWETLILAPLAAWGAWFRLRRAAIAQMETEA